MTQKIIKSNIPALNLVSSGSRYKKSSVVYYGERKFVTFELYLRQPYKPTGKEKVAVISPGMEYRPDLVSNQIYGYPDNWWWIMQVNGIFDILDFKTGRTIMLPSAT